MNVFITGASSGIGAALANEFAKRGACLGLVARRRDALDGIAAAFEAQYASDPGNPRTPATLAMPTSVPRPRAFIPAMKG